MAKHKSKKNPKRIVKARIEFISLCVKGMNNISTVYKSDDGDKSVDLVTICKEMNELGEIHAVMYAPEFEDIEGDIASEAVIKEFAHDFQKNGAGIDIKHNEEVIDKDKAFVAESFIIQKGDPRFTDMVDYDDNPVDVTGGWGVILKIEDEELRELYRSGEWSGVSMGGLAIKKEEDPTGLLKAFKDIAKYFKTDVKKQKNLENTMALTDPEKKEIAELVVKTMSDTAKIVKEAEAEKLKKELEDGPKLGLSFAKPIQKDSSEKGLTDHRKRLEIYELSKKVDPDDSRAVFNFQEKAREIAKSDDLEKTLRKQVSDQYDSYFNTNQTAEEIQKEGDHSSDPVVLALKKQNDEADKVVKTA